MVAPAARNSDRPGTIASLARAMRSWRTLSVALLSFSSGLPLGLVWYSIPDWMRSIGVDIRVVGLLSLAQAPWAFKVMWSPLMDRYVPPFWGRRRGWMAVTQMALVAFGLMLAGVGNRPEAIWVVGALGLAVAFASATQDIAIDAYAVEVLEPDEQGPASGARTAIYRAAMLLSGGVAITLAARLGWRTVNVLLALAYLPMLVLSWKAPEPAERTVPPRTLREAVWQPFLGFLARPRALEILAFVLLYKFADQLTTSLTRPFLIDMGYDAYHRGVALATVGMVATIAGSFIGGLATTAIGLGHALWAFGVLQMLATVGYYLVSRAGGPNLPLMYGATGFELFCAGLGTGAFSVLLLRITQKRFSATQYALFSSLFALPRLLAGPIAGFEVDAIGWGPFFLSAVAMGIPGLVMLARFVPLGVRDPVFDVEEPERRTTMGTTALVVRGAVGALAVTALTFLAASLLAALKTMRSSKAPFDLATAMWQVALPVDVAGWVQTAGILAFGIVGGLFAAAAAAARRR